MSPEVQVSKFRGQTSLRASSSSHSFPVIRGIQAGGEYYISMCPLRVIPKLFLFNSEELPPDMRAQRRLNRARLPAIISYIVKNPEDYVLSAITASIDGKASFEPLADADVSGTHGILKVSMDAQFIINDGQHRRAAIEKALETMPELGQETIAVVFFLDPKLHRCQQMFADLNRYAARPSASLGVLYDNRDVRATLTKRLVKKSSMFRGLIEFERTNLSPRSRKLFTLSALYGATNELFAGMDIKDPDMLAKRAIEYWNEVAKSLLEWKLVRREKITSGEVRQDFIHSHSVVLHALGKAGNILFHDHPEDWKLRLAALAKIDWRRSNADWEGRALVGGKISKAQSNVILVTNYIKARLKLPLSPKETAAEEAFRNNWQNG